MLYLYCINKNMDKHKENCTITCKGMCILFLVVAALLGLNILIVATYGLASIIMPEPLQDEIFLATSDAEPGEEEVVAGVEIEETELLLGGEFQDFTQGEVALEEESGPYYTYLQTVLDARESETEQCTLITNLMNLEDQYLATRKNIESDAFYAVAGKSLPGGEIDDFMDFFLEGSEGVDRYGHLCVLDERMYITALPEHNDLEVYLWGPIAADAKHYYFESYKGIIGMVDSFYGLFLSPVSDGLLVMTGYGDAGHLGWNFFDLNPELHYADLIEKCYIRAIFDFVTEETVGLSSIECVRQYQPE